jgi:hypothetical protein
MDSSGWEIVMIPGHYLEEKELRMKKFGLILAFLSIVTSFANTAESVYLKDSVLPQSLRHRVLDQIKIRCPDISVELGLKEISTRVHYEKIDQGVLDYFYTTTFLANYRFDGIHLSFAYITVESAEYEISNPTVDRLQILQIRSDTPFLCSDKK